MTSPQVRSIPASLRFVWLNLWFWTVAPIFSLIFGIGAFAFLYLVHLIGAIHVTHLDWFAERSAITE